MRAPRRASSTRSRTRTRSCSRRATRTSRSGRSSPLARSALRSSARTCRCVAVSPLVGGDAVTGPAARMLRRMAGGATPAHMAALIRGSHRRPRDRRGDAPATAAVETRRHADADARPRGRAAARRARPGGGMRVAVVGGTGPFGKALAARLHASGLDVIVGSRDAERAAATALELDCVGETNVEASPMRTSSSSPSTPKAALETAREATRRDRSDTRAVGRVGASLHEGWRVPVARRPLARRADPGRARRARRRRTPLARRRPASGRTSRPTRTHSSAVNDPDAKALGLELAGRLTTGRALDAGPLASARALEGLTAVIVNMNRRYKGHAGIRVTGLGLTGELRVIPLRGIPELEEGDDLGALLVDAARSAPWARSRTMSSSSPRRRCRRSRVASSTSRGSSRLSVRSSSPETAILGEPR